MQYTALPSTSITLTQLHRRTTVKEDSGPLVLGVGSGKQRKRQADPV